MCTSQMIVEGGPSPKAPLPSDIGEWVPTKRALPMSAQEAQTEPVAPGVENRLRGPGLWYQIIDVELPTPSASNS